MINVFLELERLRSTLRNRGMEDAHINVLIDRAESQINSSLEEQMAGAMDNAIQSGIQKESTEFINDLRPSVNAFALETASGNMDFSTPPLPMLDYLLASGAKPMKDGSGVYKIVPVGAPSKKSKPLIATNIFDAQKAIAAERYETSLAQYNKVKPKGSKVEFRTATSKQDRNSQWVLPGKDKDFTQDLKEINTMLGDSHDDIVMSVINSYLEDF